MTGRKPCVEIGEIINGREVISFLPKKSTSNAVRVLARCIVCGKASEIYGASMKRTKCRHCSAKESGLKRRKPKLSRTDEQRAAWAKRCRAYRKTPEGKRQTKAMNLKKFGLTIEQFETMVNEQGRACAICGDSPETLCVDHCHNTGKVRGLLCHGCNRGIGLLRDNPDILRKAAAYVEP